MRQEERQVVHGRLAALMGAAPEDAVIADEDPNLKKPKPEPCPCCGRPMPKEKK